MNQLWRYASTLLRLLLRRPITGTTLIPLLPSGQVVLVRRRDTKQWSLPGGFVDWGETIAQAAQRELREETGLTLQNIDRLLGVYSAPDRDPRFHSICVAIVVQADGQPQVNDALELSDIQPFDVDVAATLDLAHDHNQIMADFLSGCTVVV